jgi:hypothetical protein
MFRSADGKSKKRAPRNSGCDLSIMRLELVFGGESMRLTANTAQSGALTDQEQWWVSRSYERFGQFQCQPSNQVAELPKDSFAVMPGVTGVLPNDAPNCTRSDTIAVATDLPDRATKATYYIIRDVYNSSDGSKQASCYGPFEPSVGPIPNPPPP